jgi:hypothetical protein
MEATYGHPMDSNHGGNMRQPMEPWSSFGKLVIYGVFGGLQNPVNCKETVLVNDSMPPCNPLSFTGF